MADEESRGVDAACRRGVTKSKKTNYHTLGLERATPYRSTEREILRLSSQLAVIEEQRRQERIGVLDPELIALMYKATIAHRLEQCQRLASYKKVSSASRR